MALSLLSLVPTISIKDGGEVKDEKEDTQITLANYGNIVSADILRDCCGEHCGTTTECIPTLF